MVSVSVTAFGSTSRPPSVTYSGVPVGSSLLESAESGLLNDSKWSSTLRWLRQQRDDDERRRRKNERGEEPVNGVNIGGPLR